MEAVLCPWKNIRDSPILDSLYAVTPVAHVGKKNGVTMDYRICSEQIIGHGKGAMRVVVELSLEVVPGR